MKNDELRKLAEAAAKFGPNDPKFAPLNPDYMSSAVAAHRAFASKAPPDKIIELLDTIEQQRKLLEQAEKDAARFRWLYDHAWDAKYSFNKDGSLRMVRVTCKDTVSSSGLDLDRVIDEAITSHLRQQEGEAKWQFQQ